MFVASGVRYKVSGMTEDLMTMINSMVDQEGHVAVMERCEKILTEGCRLAFIGFPTVRSTSCCVLVENLDLINPRLPDVVSAMLYLHFFEEHSDVAISSITDEIIKRILVKSPDLRRNIHI